MAADSYFAYWTRWGRRGWATQLYITVVFSQGRKTALEPVLSGFARRAYVIRVKDQIQSNINNLLQLHLCPAF
jgi:hypothetical protein